MLKYYSKIHKGNVATCTIPFACLLTSLPNCPDITPYSEIGSGKYEPDTKGLTVKKSVDSNIRHLHKIMYFV